MVKCHLLQLLRHFMTSVELFVLWIVCVTQQTRKWSFEQIGSAFAHLQFLFWLFSRTTTSCNFTSTPAKLFTVRRTYRTSFYVQPVKDVFSSEHNCVKRLRFSLLFFTFCNGRRVITPSVLRVCLVFLYSSTCFDLVCFCQLKILLHFNVTCEKSCLNVKIW